jgi:hypothetical protein
MRCLPNCRTGGRIGAGMHTRTSEVVLVLLYLYVRRTHVERGERPALIRLVSFVVVTAVMDNKTMMRLVSP